MEALTLDVPAVAAARTARRAPARPSAEAKAKLRPVYRLAERCGYEADHAHQVARIAVALFDRLRPLHGLSDRRRFWLAAAALLHDIGRVDGSRRHHKTSLHLIRASPVLNWSEMQRLVVGSIARYHRKAMPHDRHEHFALLPDAVRDEVCLLGGMLRLADGLDRTHRGVVRGLDCTWDDRRLRVHLAVGRRANAEQTAGERKGDLLGAVLRRTVRVQWRLE